MNGFGIEDKLAEYFDESRIFGAMAFVCLYREDGVCKHVKYGALQAGHYHDDTSELGKVESLFAGSNVKFTTVASLRVARWEKLCWCLAPHQASLAILCLALLVHSPSPSQRVGFELAHP